MESLLESYTTPQMLTIENTRLGHLFFVLNILILIFLAFSIFIDKGYLEYDQVLGDASIEAHLDTHFDLNSFSYCNQSVGCVVRDPAEVGVSSSGNTIFIGTYIKEIMERRTCSHNSTNCLVDRIWEPISKKKSYVAGIDDVILKISHSFVAPTFFEESGHNRLYSKSNREMFGILVQEQHVEEPIVLQKFSRNLKDSIPLKRLLKVAEIPSLEFPNFFEEKNKSLRRTGFHLQLQISYDNVKCVEGWACVIGTSEPTYTYQASYVPQLASMDQILVLDEASGIRLRKSIFGVRISIQQDAKIGRFSIWALISRIVEGVGMLTVATSVVDFVGSYWAPTAPFFEPITYKI
eukprot:TRINITY_DN8065_c0_g1_i1.p1 TRINITY_DN8065_c0_g1~~TRINITY_DN8065_c0_g1_i1.p1  ORF type:complete len:350 (+),score=65.97 TRINITY_DN8065_c0_g1_i1:78-1127(+)